MTQSSKRPGGPLKSRFIQGLGGEWRDPFGKRVTHPLVLRDLGYHAGFWERHAGLPEKTLVEMRKAMLESIEKALAAGSISIFVGPKLSDEAREKLSAYKILARENGYEIGLFRHSKSAHTATAPIRTPE